MPESGSNFSSKSPNFLSRFLHPSSPEKPTQQIKITMFLTNHEDSADFNGLAEYIPQADIIIPEGSGGGKRVEKLFNRFSKGKMDMMRYRYLEYTPGMPGREAALQLFELIDGSNKTIIMVDTPPDHKIEKDLDAAEEISIPNGSFVDRIAAVKRKWKAYANAQEDREKYMLEQMQKRLKREIRRNRKLRNKPEVNILMVIGAAHAPLAHDLEQRYGKVEKVWNRKPFPYNFQDMAAMQYGLGKEIDDTLAAKALLEHDLYYDFLVYYFNRVTDRKQIFSAWQKMVNSLDYNDISDIYDKWNLVRGLNMKRSLLEQFGIKVEEKNFAIPTNAAEMDIFLQRDN